MAYADRDDLIGHRFPAARLAQIETLHGASITTNALETAQGVIDSYLMRLYSTPVAIDNIPLSQQHLLKRYNCCIARHEILRFTSNLSQADIDEYVGVMQDLEDYRDGRRTLQLSSSNPETPTYGVEQGTIQDSSGNGMTFFTPDKITSFFGDL